MELAQPQYEIKIETNVPMQTRDGVTLYADIYRPDAPGTFPVLLSRTPYGKEAASTSANGSSQFFARYGYVTVMQDCRGRFASEGDYDPIFQEVEDGYDAVEWAARLPGANGRVGTTGQSYLGLTQYAIACNDPMPPSLQAMAPVSASSDHRASWVYHTGGAAMWGWMVPYAILKGRNTLERSGRTDLLPQLDAYGEPGTNFGQPLTDAEYRHLPIQDWGERLLETAPYFAEHVRQADDGPYWDRSNLNRHAASVNVPILHISSWYDIFAEGAPSAYQSIRARSEHPAARRTQRLIMGPWAHLFPYVVPNSQGTGDIDFGPDAQIELHTELLRWFDYWLKDIDTGIMNEPPVSVFTLGENRWQSFDDWPPPTAHEVPYYLHSAAGANGLPGDGTLSTVPPTAESADHFTYDPDAPVPTGAGNNLTLPLGVADQREIEARDDVLVYTSEALDRPLEVTGPIHVTLWAASSAVDTDFTAKLVDVHPDGYAQNLLDGIIRARYRDSGSSPSLITPDQPYCYDIDLWATSTVFQPGHRIRLEISSSNFPRFDRNLNTGLPFGEGVESQTAKQTVFHETDMASCVHLPLIPR
jgi:putative CocE/NonD family hydrolase